MIGPRGGEVNCRVCGLDGEAVQIVSLPICRDKKPHKPEPAQYFGGGSNFDDNMEKSDSASARYFFQSLSPGQANLLAGERITVSRPFVEQISLHVRYHNMLNARSRFMCPAKSCPLSDNHQVPVRTRGGDEAGASIMEKRFQNSWSIQAMSARR